MIGDYTVAPRAYQLEPTRRNQLLHKVTKLQPKSRTEGGAGGLRTSMETGDLLRAAVERAGKIRSELVQMRVGPAGGGIGVGRRPSSAHSQLACWLGGLHAV